MSENLKYQELTHAIIGSAMQVHGILGNGFQEVVYQRALGIEMSIARLSFQRELELPLFYKNVEIGARRVDFFVESKVLLELKAIIQLEQVHLAQALNYLEAFNIETGLLINFGAKSLQFKRLLNKKISLQRGPGLMDKEMIRIKQLGESLSMKFNTIREIRGSNTNIP
jgi:GxxExxY protein